MTYGVAPIVACLLGDLLFVHRTELLARLGLFQSRSDFFAGCVLVGCTASTLSSAIVYTRMSGGNHALSIVLANLSSIVSVLLTPAMIGAFLGTRTGVDIGAMIGQLVLGVLVPIVLAQAVSNGFKAQTLQFRPVASMLSQFGIVVVVFTAVCKTFFQADQQQGHEFYDLLPRAGLQMVVFSVIIYTFLIRTSYRVARLAGLGPQDSVAVGYASSQKTLAATVVLAEQFFTPMAALPMIAYHLVQLLYGGFDGERLKRLAARETATSPLPDA
jgi:sodium/bile acid cotransporter 7